MSVVIVTGAFGVLGQATVRELSARDHVVVAVDLIGTHCETQAALTLSSIDLEDELAVSEAFAHAAGSLGAFDALVNVAGGFAWEPIASGSSDTWDRMFRLNVRTAVTSIRAALPHFATCGGAIVNIGSAGALNPGLGMAPYAASKAGVHALTQSLAEELKMRSIRVNAILPTILDTPSNRQSMPDTDPAAWVTPEAAARVIAFLISSDSDSITGASIPLSLAG